MSPVNASTYRGYGGDSNTIVGRYWLKFFTVITSLPYFMYVSRCKFCIGVTGAYVSRNFRCAAFFTHVAHIIFLGSGKEVGRIDTSRSVTFMEDVKPFRYFTDIVRVRKTVGEHLFGFSFTPRKKPVAPAVCVSGPEPAACGRTYLIFGRKPVKHAHGINSLKSAYSIPYMELKRENCRYLPVRKVA